jgi:hypothetical protein
MKPIEVAEIVSAAIGETVNSRQILWWARHQIHGRDNFPRPALDKHNKLIRFNRREVEEWVAQNGIGEDSKQAKTDGDTRHVKVVRRGRPRGT